MAVFVFGFPPHPGPPPVKGRPAFKVVYQNGSDFCMSCSLGLSCTTSQFFQSEISCFQAGAHVHRDEVPLISGQERGILPTTSMPPRKCGVASQATSHVWNLVCVLPSGWEPLPHCLLPTNLPSTEMQAQNRQKCVEGVCVGG